MSGTPARGYSWAPFAPGHEITLQHGAYSPRHVEPLAETLRVELQTMAPWCSAPAFAATVRAWAVAEARCRLLQAFIDEHGLVDQTTGELKMASAQAMLDRQERAAARLRAELGLTPSAWAQLRRAWVDDPEVQVGGLASLKATGRAIAAAAAATPDEGDDDDDA